MYFPITPIILIQPIPLIREDIKQKKRTSFSRGPLVGLPGFEPGMTGPESVVLPLHHSPIFVFDGAKVE